MQVRSYRRHIVSQLRASTCDLYFSLSSGSWSLTIFLSVLPGVKIGYFKSYWVMPRASIIFVVKVVIDNFIYPLLTSSMSIPRKS